jgi:hypothetical protein
MRNIESSTDRVTVKERHGKQEALLAETGPINRETFVSSTILLVLVMIAAGVFYKQFHYDPILFIAAAPEGDSSRAPIALEAPDASAPELQSYLPENWKPLTPVEIFGRENLSDKINGKAELYLSAGFLKLQCRRFSQADKPELWMEVFVYDMGDMRNAFSVYSAQKRSDAQPLNLTQFAYSTSNAVFFVHGNKYVEVVAASASDETAAAMLSFVRNFVGEAPAESGQVDELSLFPPEGLDKESITLHAKDVFSFDRLDNVLTAGYTINGRQLTAFVSSRETPEKAAELAAAYHQFLIENGGEDVKPGVDIPGAMMVEIFDMYELIFTDGSFLAGVYEADEKELAEQLALKLHRGLTRSGK